MSHKDYTQVPMVYDDRLTAEQKRSAATMTETHFLHVHEWTREAFMAYVNYTAMFVGDMHAVTDETRHGQLICYANRRKTLGYNGHLVVTTTVMMLHNPDDGAEPDAKPWCDL